MRAQIVPACLLCLLCLVAGASPASAQLTDPEPTAVMRAAPTTGLAAPDQATAVPTPTVVATAPPTASPTDPPTAVPTAVVTPSVTPVPVDRPILVVVDSDVEPDYASPGQEIKVVIAVENVGRIDAENVQLTLSSDVFLPVGHGSTLYKEEIDAGETRPFKVTMRVNSAADSGTYSLGLLLRWEDASGNAFSDQSAIGIQVVAPSTSQPLISVSNTHVPTRSVPGIPFSIGLELRNIGGAEARNVVVAPTDGPLTLYGGGPAPISIPPGGAASVELRMMAAPVAEPGAATQRLDVRYDDAEGERYTTAHQIGITVADNSALGPLPMVARYTFGDEINPGQVFDLALEITNVGAQDALRTRLALGGGTTPTGTDASTSGASLGVFAPLGTSNVRYLGRVASGASVTETIRMVVDGAAKPGVYLLDVAFGYVDADGGARASSEVVSLLVSREVRLEINPITVITQTVVGAQVPFSVEIINAGEATVNVGNADVLPGRYMDVVDGTVYVGPLDAGAIFPLDATLIPKAPSDEAKVVVAVEYTDDFNREQVYEEAFEFVIDEQPEVPIEAVEEAVPTDESLISRVLKGLLGLGASLPPGAAAAPEPAIGDAVVPVELETAP